MVATVMGWLDALMNLVFNGFRKVVGLVVFVAILASLVTALFMSIGYAVIR